PPILLPAGEAKIAAFAQRAGIAGADLALLRQALTHRSLGEETEWGDNERLEFLGDSILGVLVSEYLYETFPDHSEGQLTRLRAGLVSRATLAQAAGRLGLGGLLAMATPERSGGGAERPGTQADAFEAVLAAVYLSLGLQAARDYVRREVISHVDIQEIWDYKSRLQELMQSRRRATPTYR